MSDGSCQEKCYSSDMCNTGLECYNGKCIKSCKNDNNCALEQYCHMDHKLCHFFCKSTKECPQSYSCYDKKCYKDCYDMDECGKNHYCNE